MLRLLILLLVSVSLLAQTAQTAPIYTIKVVKKKPQSRQNFVQGLEINDGFLYVSTGNYGKSRLLRYHLSTGKLDRARRLDDRIFGEGLTVFGDKVYQLTWRNQVMLVYDKQELKPLQRIPITGEGWGLTHNADQLIYSNGSEKLYFMSPETGKILRSVTVIDQGSKVLYLNELEWIDGSIWANIWRSNRIVMIDPSSGQVTGSIDLTGLLPASDRRGDTDVLNGIARNPADDSIWVTGKHWPWQYQIELLPLPGSVP
ncbi:MAG: glutamine cyclotransferase [Halioglobus sp.]